ncbi:hypothetical protein GLW08_08360 [Pontibacillus yanchengensis]|uniref:Uncharacterized protein n=1 Tax=Pontibacillus yanchengensis TaxID=462910 RepID=A0ACC7VHD8_9BACI|nr:hypothetical protein [Pontibacillus yanchengensis]MYL53349.1 hypothetical protein [Pontibacillus yanchengensis]
MFKNEKGSALLFVLLMVVMFSILGLSVLGATVSGGKRTELQEDQVQSIHEAKKAIQQGVVLIQSYFEDYSLKEMDDYQNDIDDFNNLELSYDGTNTEVRYTIQNVTDEETDINTDTNYTRVFEITSRAEVDGTGGAPAQVHEFSKRIYLSATPTALQNGMGAKKTLQLNGSPEISGNVYASVLNLSKEGYYEFGSTRPNFKTKLYPIIQPLNTETIQQQQAIVSIADKNSFQTVNNNEEFLNQEASNFALENISVDKYQGINVAETFNDKSSSYKPEYDKDHCVDVDPFGNIKGENGKVLLKNGKVMGEDETINEYIVSTQCPGVPNKINKFMLYDSENLLGEDSWLYVEGNIDIIGSREGIPEGEIMKIEQNLLVDGNLFIDGTIQFNSATYTTGTSEIYNSNIIGKEDEQLALFSQDNLIISRINEFEDPSEDQSTLKAFFYSDKNIDLYAVGSYIHINGGIFSGNNLTANATRGNIYLNDVEDGNNILGEATGNPRLQIEYDPTIVFNKSQALPRVERLQVYSNSLQEKSYNSN